MRGTKWTGRPLEYNENSSYDAGKTWKVEKGQLIYSAHFYKANEIVHHSFKAQTILDIIAYFGGLLKLVISKLQNFYFRN